MKKFFLAIFLSINVFVFAQNTTKDFRKDLNLDGVEDLLVQSKVANFDKEEDVLKITVDVTIKLLNKDGSVKNTTHFVEYREFFDDEYDGSLSYKAEDGKIVRNLITGRGSYKNYIDSYFVYDKLSDNWRLEKRTTLEAPQHENKFSEEQFLGQNIFLFDKQAEIYSGEDIRFGFLGRYYKKYALEKQTLSC